MAAPQPTPEPTLAEASARHAPARGGASGAPAQPHPRQAEIDELDRLADLLDSRYSILGIRFGLDGILSLVPGVGDLAALAPSAWIAWRARGMGVSNAVLGRMAGNVALDFVVGSIPILGTVFDVFFKANRRNIALLKQEIARA